MTVRAATLLLAALPAPAFAQAYQCTVPQGALSIPQPRGGDMRRVPVTGYTLALSWSPEFCRTRQRSAANATQCSGQNGRFGLVVHGLWPEGRDGWPQYCPTRLRLSPEEARRNLCMMPGTRLQADEWARHGACMVRRPESYFKVTRILWNSLRLPDLDALSRRKGLTAGDVRQAFAMANPGFTPGSVGLATNDRGWLEELRLCYRKDFRPGPCDSRRRGPADSQTLKIWRGL